MKLSDYVADYTSRQTESVFLISGGGNMHLTDSLCFHKKLKTYCCHHEQAVATAAEGYARLKNNIGIGLVTTGPGGTNAITGIAGAWADSIPVLIISGQVKTDNITPRRKGIPTLRTLGFQEINIIDMVKPITKYAVTVMKKDDIRYHLEKAVYLAKSGRPGPVWIDIPLDIQAMQIDPQKLKGYSPPIPSYSQTKLPMQKIVKVLERSKRPLLLIGNGVRLAHAIGILHKVINKLKINVVSTYFTSDDIILDDYPYYLGRQGIPGHKTANYAVDNCDLLLILGERMQLTQTSYEYKDFAPSAVKIMVDIDKEELFKKTVSIDIPVWTDAKSFLESLYKEKITLKRWSVVREGINPDDYMGNKNYTNVFKFIETLNKWHDNYHIVTSDGMASVATHYLIKLAKGQRCMTNAGLGQMGSGLPMAIGACIASGKSPTICMEGDGSIMLNIHELQTALHHKLPLKLFIFNNNGYYSIRTTFTNYFKRVSAADPDSGVTLPNFERLVKAWGIEYMSIKTHKDLYKVKKVFQKKGFVICEVFIDPFQPMPAKWSAGQFVDKSLL